MNIPSINGTLIAADSSGNVGIGATDMTASGKNAKLAVVGNINLDDDNFIAWGGGTSRPTFSGNKASNYMYWSTNGSERMRIDSDGVVYQSCTGVTGDAPNAAGGVLTQPNGNTKIRVPINGGGVFQFYSPSGGTGSPVGSVTANASSTSYNTSSDYRLKQDVEPMTGALNMVAQLKPVTYTWKNTGEAGQGFIAHELQEVVPDCVTGEKDAVDAEGNPVYQGIDTSFLVATLTAAIQELKQELDTVKAELTALKGVA
jgi:hypothetical protein